MYIYLKNHSNPIVFCEMDGSSHSLYSHDLKDKFQGLIDSNPFDLPNRVGWNHAVCHYEGKPSQETPKTRSCGQLPQPAGSWAGNCHLAKTKVTEHSCLGNENGVWTNRRWMIFYICMFFTYMYVLFMYTVYMYSLCMSACVHKRKLSVYLYLNAFTDVSMYLNLFMFVFKCVILKFIHMLFP